MAAEQPPKPIRSLREDDPAIEEQLDAFIATLGETIDYLQDTELSGDVARLRIQALELEASATELGYPALGAAAARVAEGCGEESPEAAHKAMRDLTEVSQRVRRGHRSAA